jgi:hypothetical protein
VAQHNELDLGMFERGRFSPIINFPPKELAHKRAHEFRRIAMSRTLSNNLVCSMLTAMCLTMPPQATACNTLPAMQVSSSAEINNFIRTRKVQLLTFTGYSGAGYEDENAMLAEAARILANFSPATTMINIGATAEGIGAVYALAKSQGFTTTGIVSTLAGDEKLALSPCVDHVFYIQDSTWGGRLADSDELSPTSAAIVANSAAMFGIGGGEIARDEMLAARQAGKPVTFIPAEMNRQLAREKARSKGQPEPTDFSGAAHAALASPR